MRLILATTYAIFFLAVSCRDNSGTAPLSCTNTSEFLPLQTGNYWKVDDKNYVEVARIKRFNGIAYAQCLRYLGYFNTPDTSYYRVDKSGVLIRYFPYLNVEERITKFCTYQGERFTLREDISVDVSSITTVKAGTDTLIFEYNVPGVCTGPGPGPCPNSVYRHTYVRNIGWADAEILGLRGKFTEIKIGSRIRRL